MPPRPLNAREYKILLDPRSLGTDDAAAEDFLAVAVRPLVADYLDGVSWSVTGPKRRRVRFLDTPALALDLAHLSLRLRREEGEDEACTLKLRTADRFVAAAADISASGKGEGKFEEDIAPLEVLSPAGGVTVADPPEIRSRFSLSVTEPSPGRMERLRDALDLFPNLDEVLRRACISHAGAPLLEGPPVQERVFDGPTLRFGRGVEAPVVLTLWTLGEPPAATHVAEISYRCKLEEDQMPGPPARAALKLFQRMQTGLRVDLKHPSKTRLALPQA